MESYDLTKNKFFLEQFRDEKLVVTQQLKLEEEGFCVRYDQAGEYIAIGCNNGTKHIYSLAERKIILSIPCQGGIPITSLRWRPQQYSKSKVLVTTNSDGILTHWHIPSGKKLFSLQEKDNSILCLDYSRHGTHFATAGKDFNIRIYDQTTKSIDTVLEAAQWNSKGHSNRIFAVKYVDQNTLISGGWDSVIYIWDIRTAKSVRSIYGPHLAGDALDYQDNKILTGSHSNVDQLQIWDFKTTKLIQTLDWESKKSVPYLYSVQFGKLDKNMILAGCSGTNQVKVFKEIDEKYKSLNKISNLGGGCYSTDFSYTKREFVFTDATGRLCFVQYGVK